MTTVKPSRTDPLRYGQPMYNGRITIWLYHRTNTFSTSETWTISKLWQLIKGVPPNDCKLASESRDGNWRWDICYLTICYPVATTMSINHSFSRSWVGSEHVSIKLQATPHNLGIEGCGLLVNLQDRNIPTKDKIPDPMCPLFKVSTISLLFTNMVVGGT